MSTFETRETYFYQMTKFRGWLITIALVGLTTHLSSQTNSLTLDSCHQWAKQNYPLVKQYALIEQSKDFSLDNAAKGYLPQVHVAGQASLQSDVTQLPVSLPNLSIPSMSKDQYKIYGEISQPLTDLFTLKHQRRLIESNSEVEEQKLEVELFKLKERINQLFFGMLMLDAQLEQTLLRKKEILTGLDKTMAAVANGVALQSSLDVMNVELLTINQKTIELKAARNGFSGMLSLFIHQPVDESTRLVKPGIPIISKTVNRPELIVFDRQKKTFDIQSKLITDKNIPRFNLFFQGGYGRPALNMLNNEFDTYYIGGLRLSWNLSGFYTATRERKILFIQKNMVGLQHETFLFNTNLTLTQQNSEISKLQELLDTDDDIIRLRENIKNTAKNQLEYGTITTIDYILFVNAEDLAKQNKLLHEIQLLLAHYNYQTTSGN